MAHAPGRVSRQRPLNRLNSRALVLSAALFLLLGGIALLFRAAGQESRAAQPPTPTAVQRLTSGAAASMDSPVFTWSPGWDVGTAGATPEPADPEAEPAGVVAFDFSGRELALLLAVGDYWGYLYVTVDGKPAALLPDSRFHLPPVSPRAGYAPLLAPEAVDDAGNPTERWLRVEWVPDRPHEPRTHTAEITVWRSWGQTPLRAVAVDVKGLREVSRTPGMAMLMAALLLGATVWLPRLTAALQEPTLWSGLLTPLARPLLEGRWRRRAQAAAVAGLLLLAAGILLDSGGTLFGLPAWAPALSGLGLLAAAGLVWPALWYGALMAALPLYYQVALPLLPARAFNLIDVGAYGGLALTLAHALLAASIGRVGRARVAPGALVLLVLIAAWSAVSLFGAQHFAVALREVRTIFVMAVALASGMLLMLRTSHDAAKDLTVIVAAWLAGAALIAGSVALQYPHPAIALPAEGVMRLRGYYGSPNNLALYLERVLAVALAVAIAGRAPLQRGAAAAAAALSAVALVLTFSKGALFVALPVMLLVIAAGAAFLLRRQHRSTRVLWLLGALALLVLFALLPFVTTERLQSLVDLSAGTGLLRVNLWRASLQMALDHGATGVGPDNFLYAYRSGYILPQAWMEPNLNHPHNFVLDWWTRLGLPGLLLGLTFWGVLGAALLRRLLNAPAQRESRPALYLGLCAAMAASLAHGLLDASFALPDLMAVWALFTVLATAKSPQSPPQ